MVTEAGASASSASPFGSPTQTRGTNSSYAKLSAAAALKQDVVWH